MTVTQILQASGVKYNKKNASRIGHLIANKAKEDGIKFTQTTETINVNDYPDTFQTEMEGIVIEYFQSKNK